MYKFISTLLLLFSLSGVQAEGIQFRDMSLPEAQVAAGKEGKLVFVDCYTPSAVLVNLWHDTSSLWTRAESI